MPNPMLMNRGLCLQGTFAAVAEISVGWGANLSEIFISSEVRKYMSYSDKTVRASRIDVLACKTIG